MQIQQNFIFGICRSLDPTHTKRYLESEVESVFIFGICRTLDPPHTKRYLESEVESGKTDNWGFFFSSYFLPFKGP